MKSLMIGLFIILSGCHLSYSTKGNYTVECTCERLVYDNQTYVCRICDLPIPVKYRYEGNGIGNQRPIRNL